MPAICSLRHLADRWRDAAEARAFDECLLGLPLALVETGARRRARGFAA